MNEVILVALLSGWFGFWFWLWWTAPEKFRRAHAAMQGAIDRAASAASDAVHRAVSRKKR